MRSDGSHRRSLYPGGWEPRNAPNGGSILFNADGSTMRMGQFGGNPHPIDTGGLGGAQIAPAGGCMVGMGRPPGGRNIGSAIYAHGAGCPATGLLKRGGYLYGPDWQPLP
jgi:hypothetical protein